jgi:hypothetical protein
MLRDHANGHPTPAPTFERQADEQKVPTKNFLTGPSNNDQFVLLTRIAEALERLNQTIAERQPDPSPPASISNSLLSMATSIGRIADTMNPPPPNVVDSTYIATKLGCTTTWIAEMARSGDIPKSCLVPGTGNGKPWKFYRNLIEKWIESR